MKNLNLVTVVGDFHANLTLVQMLRHYKPVVDKIYVVYYQTGKEGEESQRDSSEFLKYLEKYDVKPNQLITHVGKKYDWDKVTELYNQITKTDKRSFWIIADADEFQYWPKNPREIAKDCERRGCTFVTGGFIDRIGEDGVFTEIKGPEDDLDKLFPLAGFFRYPLSKACPNKVVMVKGGQKVCSGQHYAVFDDGTNSWGKEHPLRYPIDECFVQTHHFKWDNSIYQRLTETGESGCKYSEEYSLMKEEIEKNGGKINIDDRRFMFERFYPEDGFGSYRNWNKLKDIIVKV